MTRRFKLLISLTLLLTMLVGMFGITSFAAVDGTTVYFAPDSNWRSDNARFAIYAFKGSNDYKWIEMTDDDGDDIYEAVVPSEYTKIIFCRLDPDNTHNGWSATWNQTVDLTLPTNGDNLFTITNPWGSDSNGKKGEGKWSLFSPDACNHDYGTDCICTKCGHELFYIVAGYLYKNGDVYAEGDNTTIFGSKWDVTDENNRMEYDPQAGCYVMIYENVAKGEYAFKIAENKSWDVSYGWDGGNCYIKVEESGSTVVITLKDGNITCAADLPLVPEKPEDKPNDNTDKTPENDADKAPDENHGDKSDDTTIGNENPPVERLNFFQRIWLAITNFFKKLFGTK